MSNVSKRVRFIALTFALALAAPAFAQQTGGSGGGTPAGGGNTRTVASGQKMKIKGVVETVLSRGRVVIEGGEYLGKPGDGRFLKRGTCVAL